LRQAYSTGRINQVNIFHEVFRGLFPSCIMHADRSQPRDITTKERCSFAKRSPLQQTFAVADSANNSTALQTHRQKKIDESFLTLIQSALATMQLVSSVGRDIRVVVTSHAYSPYQTTCLLQKTVSNRYKYKPIISQSHATHIACQSTYTCTHFPSPHRFTQETVSLRGPSLRDLF